jgi:hypothetical protein
MVWYGMVWYGMAWYGLVWLGMVWFDDGVLAIIHRINHHQRIHKGD